MRNHEGLKIKFLGEWSSEDDEEEEDDDVGSIGDSLLGTLGELVWFPILKHEKLIWMEIKSQVTKGFGLIIQVGGKFIYNCWRKIVKYY